MARMLAKQNRRMLVVHADSQALSDILMGRDGFFPKLAERALRDGIPTRAVRANSKVADMMRDQSLGYVHIMFGDRAGYAPDRLHVGAGPVRGFWYLDELGIGPNSTLRFGQFAPERIDKEAAEYFFNGVTSWQLEHNISPVDQPSRLDPPPAKARVALFCQEIEQQPIRMHYLSTEQMIRAIAEYETQKVIYVKMHPMQSKPMRRAIVAVAQEYPNVQISEASVHDLVAAADLVVTQNSRAGFEALMQKKPVVTCGKSDYWQATLTARTAEDLCEALDFGVEAMADFPYEKYFFWYLHRHLLEEAKEDFAERAWTRIVEKAFI
ncbi:hypothetical protein [Maritimibacter dapengensis]|uniref:Capsule polysaccharide biosynthesis protein n=1 Tax=Maritimibacter dapengensis TaxID=2836868 RepID=A0ABS6T691_9RHOB|nr:hypothetical protein [Maritimibacter dapengensis]MBV7380669.1 hypothetical protein [Maritimibacter dapengensis]